MRTGMMAGIAALFWICPAMALDYGFTDSRAVTVSELSATLSHSSMNFVPAAVTRIEGNTVTNAMNNSTGVVGIIQNNGAQSNVQQAITVHIDRLVLNR